MKYEDFVAKQWWDLLTAKLAGLSYEEIKKLESKGEQLWKEVNKWEAWRRGDSLGYYKEFDSFLRKYVRLSITQEKRAQ